VGLLLCCRIHQLSKEYGYNAVQEESKETMKEIEDMGYDVTETHIQIPGIDRIKGGNRHKYGIMEMLYGRTHVPFS
jgi:tRNA G26 N,N-dimethylase Trm1